MVDTERGGGGEEKWETYITVLPCINFDMTRDRKDVVVTGGHSFIERHKTTQVLADDSSRLYIRPRKHSVAPLRRPNYELGVFHVLKIRLGSVNAPLPGALV